MLVKYFFAYCLYVLYNLFIDYLGIRFFSKPPLPPKFKNLFGKIEESLDQIPRITWCIEFLSVTPRNLPKYNIRKIHQSRGLAIFI